MISISWARVMIVPKEDIKKKISWYDKHKDQQELGEFLEEGK